MSEEIKTTENHLTMLPEPNYLLLDTFNKYDRDMSALPGIVYEYRIYRREIPGNPPVIRIGDGVVIKNEQLVNSYLVVTYTGYIVDGKPALAGNTLDGKKHNFKIDDVVYIKRDGELLWQR